MVLNVHGDWVRHELMGYFFQAEFQELQGTLLDDIKHL